jgi:anthranilate synthase component 1
MLVDLARNDLGRWPSRQRRGRRLHGIEKLHVMHIVSTVKAELGEGYDCSTSSATFRRDAERRAEDPPEIISRPKVAAAARTGDVFYMGFNGNFDSCITIRTILAKDGSALSAGAGRSVRKRIRGERQQGAGPV